MNSISLTQFMVLVGICKLLRQLKDSSINALNNTYYLLYIGTEQ